MRTRTLLAGGLIAVGLSAIGIQAGPASAHDLNGGSAQNTCVPGDGVDVTWTFTSSNATGHHIVKVVFDRSVDGYSFTPDSITAHTNEVAGTTVSLKATATFEDQFVTSFKVTTTIPTDQCPPTTTVPPTTVPPTTVPPTTVPEVTTVPTTVPDVTTVPTTTPPSVDASTTVPGSDTSVDQGPTTTICTPAGAPIVEGSKVCALPTTAADSTDVLAWAVILLAVGIGSVVITRRRATA